ncbi:MAG TPA: hypothetical protein PLY90_02515 [Candidatus Hydrogenedentes bacterium]|jgi:hypothetical protein|nr:MAG: hypothetical protein BWY07_02144 [Candidatus Hydrogenedentes bacterium ADurb.Bin170]HNZ49576.1 hypothetical protein [Candidatus Hydrogenedentota bacterium]HOD96064.1 hypothetical protein [Candidatus Hydrogenedentota bacterium]HOR51558.1 hypothetical protein [Candidatus Hydrogenedentota bacterium]HPK25454.1 hypothetical protein [Candidatus Hydrogenedentota bacterium]
MNQEVFAPPEYKEGIDADAVCGQCNTVNPEGTLLCKVCGNNLRDQRLLRMTADQMLEGEAKSASNSTLLYKLLPILGLLFVLWLGVNARQLMTSMTSTQKTDYELAGALAASLWNGEGKERYDDLAARIQLTRASETAADHARLTVRPMSAIKSGSYAVFMRTGTEERFVGIARIAVENDSVYYAALMKNATEFRGKASLSDGLFVSRWDNSGLFSGGAFYAMAGTAQIQPDGSVSLSGQSDLNTLQYNCSAYLMQD